MPEAQSTPQQAHRRFLTFRADGRLYALPAAAVAEVIRTPPAARVPQAPAALAGLANLRGVVLPLVSLRALLGLAGSEIGEHARAIVLDGAAPVALAVDAVEALFSVSDGRIETRQTEFAAGPGEKITGAFQTGSAETAKVLDIETLLKEAFAQRVQSKAVSRTTAPPAGKSGERRNVASEALVTFDVAGQEYALALSSVQEIVPAPESVTPLPHAENLVVGMIAFRERLLPLLSLRGLLGFPTAQVRDGREKVVVAHIGGALVGLVADRARAIVAAEQDLIDPIPPVLAARSGGEARIKAIYRGDQGRRLISILATDQMFRDDVMRHLGSEQKQGAAQMTRETGIERQFLVFRLGADEFGLPIEAVDEVSRVPDQITRLPKTPKFLEGVVNLRGEVLPVVDQRRRFDMPMLENREGRRLVVVRTERHRAGLIVDAVSEVLRSRQDAIEPPPELTGDITRLVQGVINIEKDGRIILLLDPAELLTRAERGLLDAFEAKKAAS